LRSGLTVFQFLVSTSLLIATIIVFQQLRYMQNKKLGYDGSQVIFLPDARLLGPQQSAFKQQLLAGNQVIAASISRSVPGGDVMDGTEVYPRNENSNGTEIHMNIAHVDYDYLKTLGIRMVAGRNFQPDFPTDSASGVIINEAAVRQLGWQNETAVGKTIVRSGQAQLKVIGVVADYNYASVKESVAPIMLMLGNNYGGLIVKVRTGSVTAFLEGLKSKWSSFSPAGPLEYTFLDETFARLYAGERRTQKIFFAFTVLAIIIASLGLFGLSAFVIEQRAKEIGLRKVLGATVAQVLVLVSKEFLILVLVAFTISVPVTAWAMHAWLLHFAYRIHLSAWIFSAGGVAVLLIAISTVSVQAVRAAVANPVRNLRSE
jgi:putative ABC transport system permease protein